jgi:hypothetical protein
LPRKVRAAAGEEAGEALAPASVLAVAALVECPAAVVQELADLVLAVGRVQRGNQAAFGTVAVAVPVPEEAWVPVAPRVEEQATVRGAEEVRVREDPADPVAALVVQARAEELELAAVVAELERAAARAWAVVVQARAEELGLAAVVAELGPAEARASALLAAGKLLASG